METAAIILTLGLINYLMRSTPFLVFGEKKFSPVLQRWLEFVPIAVLSAILAPMLLMPEGLPDVSFKNLMLLAAIPTFIAAIVSKSMGITLLLGVASMAVLQYIM